MLWDAQFSFDRGKKLGRKSQQLIAAKLFRHTDIGYKEHKQLVPKICAVQKHIIKCFS